MHTSNRFSDDISFMNHIYSNVTEALKYDDRSQIEMTVVISMILVEYLVKESLRVENPLLPYNLSRLQTEHTNMAYLLKLGPEDTPSARYDDLGVLISRSKELLTLPKDTLLLIDYLRNERNKVAHDPRHIVDHLVCHISLIELMVSNYSHFHKYLNISLDPKDEKLILDKLPTLNVQLSDRLDHKIERHKKEYANLNKQAKDALKENSLILGSDQFIIVNQGMRCPSCYNSSLYFIGSVDVDYDGISTESWLECRVCGLEMDESEFDELNTNTSKYTRLDENEPSWNLFYENRDWQERAVDYI